MSSSPRPSSIERAGHDAQSVRIEAQRGECRAPRSVGPRRDDGRVVADRRRQRLEGLPHPLAGRVVEVPARGAVGGGGVVRRRPVRERHVRRVPIAAVFTAVGDVAIHPTSAVALPLPERVQDPRAGPVVGADGRHRAPDDLVRHRAERVAGRAVVAHAALGLGVRVGGRRPRRPGTSSRPRRCTRSSARASGSPSDRSSSAISPVPSSTRAPPSRIRDFEPRSSHDVRRSTPSRNENASTAVERIGAGRPRRCVIVSAMRPSTVSDRARSARAAPR